jgi:dipeptidyl aminopeptidase/acylaminoacyl peptidase
VTPPQAAPYGSWRSPISAAAVARAAVRFGSLAVDGADVYWVEGRPDEGGRSVLVRACADGPVTDVTPPPFNVRSRVHEYGGGAFAAAAGEVVFAHFPDQRLYRLDVAAGEPALPLTEDSSAPGGPRLRYADIVFDAPRRRLLCVREDHRGPPPGSGGAGQAVNAVVAVDLSGPPGAPEGAAQRVLVSGADFYANPRLSPDGARLCWLAWSHPNMPWDGTELWVGDLAPDGTVAAARRVAGVPAAPVGLAPERRREADAAQEAVFQPEWGPDGRLYFVSDRSGWWNLYRLGEGDAVEALAPMEAEFGQPQWVFGSATYGFAPGPDGPAGAPAIVCASCRTGVWRLGRLDPRSGHLEDVATPYTDFHSLHVLPDGSAVVEAGSPQSPPAIVRVHLPEGRCHVLRAGGAAGVGAAYLSTPRAITFPTTGGETAHAFFYPPANGDFRAPPDERPPLLVKSHGGPTAAASATFALNVQFWTSRGVAVLDVNYGGSTGYGRDYRRRLEGRWGVVDVDDCTQGALALAAQGEVDPRRLLISGGSAGGYTTLCALTFRDAFRAGGSYYGVSDLQTLASDTHKFESRYLDRLVGPYPARRDRYLERSPIHHVDRLARPIVFFQGLEDAIVPPSQAETMVAALRARGLPVAYLPFPGEQHGFRQAAHIARALEAELYFYSRICDFPLAGDVEPLPIENL